jgi:recombination protein RecA
MSKKEPTMKEVVQEIEQTFGQGSIFLLGDTEVPEIDVISTGSMNLDKALGAGGFPKGRIIEIFGNESSGKTTLTLHAAIECQKAGGNIAFIDAEHALDITYAKKLGLDTDAIVFSQPDNGEQALEMLEALVRTGKFDLIIVDSVAALTPRAEIEGSMGDSHMGLQARMMSQAMRKLTDPIKKTNTCVIFINQLRMKIGIVFGNPNVTTGGNALKFYASVRLDIRKRKPIKVGEEVVGNDINVKVVKNKVGPPLREAEFQMLYGVGIDRLGELIEAAVTLDIVEKKGSWYSYNGEKLGQGLHKVKDHIEGSPLEIEIREKVLEVF